MNVRIPEVALTTIGIALSFLGVVLLALLDTASGVALAAAAAVTLLGLGLLLSVIVRHAPR